MLADNVAHGINLRKSPCLQYLFYLGQVGRMGVMRMNNRRVDGIELDYIGLDFGRVVWPRVACSTSSTWGRWVMG